MSASDSVLPRPSILLRLLPFQSRVVLLLPGDARSSTRLNSPQFYHDDAESSLQRFRHVWQ
jgi:hypothetical protein